MLIADYKDNDLWVREKRLAGNVKQRTRAYSVWLSMMHRCEDGGFQQKRRPSYAGCTVGGNFKDFQYFAEWCNSQAGYFNVDEKGRHWQLDKDLLVKGNKVYSENTCVFLPHSINSALTAGNSQNRAYRRGVTYCKLYNKFLASHKTHGVQTFIGYFGDEGSAFAAYKTARELYLRSLAETFKQQLSVEAFYALNNYKIEECD